MREVNDSMLSPDGSERMRVWPAIVMTRGEKEGSLPRGEGGRKRRETLRKQKQLQFSFKAGHCSSSDHPLPPTINQSIGQKFPFYGTNVYIVPALCLPRKSGANGLRMGAGAMVLNST